ncbi:hypothetical protein BST61_g3448 [Cercospora zeina]
MSMTMSRGQRPLLSKHFSAPSRAAIANHATPKSTLPTIASRRPYICAIHIALRQLMDVGGNRDHDSDGSICYTLSLPVVTSTKMSTADQDGEKAQDLQRTLKCMDYPEAIVAGNDIYEYFGRRFIEHTIQTGRALAIKLMVPPGDDDEYDGNRSEAAMMHYAATQGVQAPKVLGVYDIVTTRPSKPIAVAMESIKRTTSQTTSEYASLHIKIHWSSVQYANIQHLRPSGNNTLRPFQ